MATISENLQTIQSSLANIKTAIVDKGVNVDGDITTYADKIASIETGGSGGGGATPSRPNYTGHADADGLRAIGWTDEDIAYYQANGVNWNEEDDEYHKVTDDNKALYGVLTASNISTYKDRIVYLPKIDTSGLTSMFQMFTGCKSLIAIPLLDTSGVTNMEQMFITCYSLTTIPQLDTRFVSNMRYMFSSCYSLTTIPQLNTGLVWIMDSMFNGCFSLTTIPQLDTSRVTSMKSMFGSCFALTAIPQLNIMGVTSNLGSVFTNNSSLTHLYINGIKASCSISNSPLITKDSLLYLINNEAATSTITITLHSYAYTRLATDADVVAALANHPNISLASA